MTSCIFWTTRVHFCLLQLHFLVKYLLLFPEKPKSWGEDRPSSALRLVNISTGRCPNCRTIWHVFDTTDTWINGLPPFLPLAHCFNILSFMSDFQTCFMLCYYPPRQAFTCFVIIFALEYTFFLFQLSWCSLRKPAHAQLLQIKEPSLCCCK